MSIKTPRLIRDRCGVFYFRLIVPLALREVVGKKEFRRSLRTKDSAIARQRALSLSIAVEAVMVNPRFLSNPTLADFPHLLQKDVDVRKKIRIDLDRGIVETDTLDEAKEAVQITANMAEDRKAKAAMQAALATTLPVSKCGTTLTQAKEGYLAEKKATLKEATFRKWQAVLGEFIGFAGDIDVAMVDSKVIRNFKKKLLADERAATTINDKISILNGFFEYCIDNNVAKMENPAKGLFIVGRATRLSHTSRSATLS